MSICCTRYSAVRAAQNTVGQYFCVHLTHDCDISMDSKLVLRAENTVNRPTDGTRPRKRIRAEVDSIDLL